MISKSSVLLGVGFLVTVGCASKDKDPVTPVDHVASTAGSSSAAPTSTTAATPPPDKGDKGIGSGDAAPTFTLDSLNGAGKLEVAKGKVTLVDFWATWCEPCKKSFPKLQELHMKHKSSGLNIVAISVDDENTKIKGFASRFSAKFPVGWDNDHSLAKKYFGAAKDPTMPTSFLIDKTGKIRFVHTGYHDGEEQEIEKEYKQLAAEKP